MNLAIRDNQWVHDVMQPPFQYLVHWNYGKRTWMVMLEKIMGAVFIDRALQIPYNSVRDFIWQTLGACWQGIWPPTKRMTSHYQCPPRPYLTAIRPTRSVWYYVDRFIIRLSQLQWGNLMIWVNESQKTVNHDVITTTKYSTRFAWFYALSYPRH